jgi:YbbR domain-containing protein
MIRILKNLIVRNWGFKLFSFVLALILWLFLIPEEKVFSERTIAVPLEIRNSPSRMELVEKPASTIDVTIRAANRVLNTISSRDVSATLDLSNATVYQQEYPLNNAMITLPPGAEVVRINPNKVELKLELTRRLELDVSPTLRGKVAEGFRVVKTDVNPAKVMVAGPESKIRAGDEVRTAPVDISGLTQSTVFEVDLILPKPELRLATSQLRVRVSVIVEETKAGRDSPAAKKK